MEDAIFKHRILIVPDWRKYIGDTDVYHVSGHSLGAGSHLKRLAVRRWLLMFFC